MNIKAYIESGTLELYVAGALSEKESQEVYNLTVKHPELLEEALKIEATIVKLTAATAPIDSQSLFNNILSQISTNNNVRPLNQTKKHWFTYVSWAASIVFAAGLLWFANQNIQLKEQLRIADTDKELLETQIENSRNSLTEAKALISVLRDKDIITVPLDGQAISPEAYAKVYWDVKGNNIVLDVQGLPDPPKGKVYQVWSLTLNPLTPTSLGVIENFTTDENKLFTIANTNASEAFGITLEPDGGSESPTLEQLYTLGAVATTP
ncbi:anti-sigma factor domain-containing protein [Lacinutrix iliipiscaria]|uniref:Anti-sigma factor domain-containing protein n=1 Tax=Lacinutrix iliipiscaria TaxID=1230532 RepID=A0ABW5WNW7_9FLAO